MAKNSFLVEVTFKSSTDRKFFEKNTSKILTTDYSLQQKKPS